MQTISALEFHQKYGGTPPPIQPTGYLGGVKQAFDAGLSQAQQGLQDRDSTNSLIKKGEGLLKFGAGVVNTVFSPIAPALEATVGKGINYAGEQLAKAPGFADFANSDAGALTERIAEDTLNASTIAGAFLPLKAKAPSLPKVSLPKVGEAASYTKSAVRDIVPTKQRVINHQVSKALDLTPGDLNNIYRSTGNDVGQWLSEHNLIGTNKETTQANINSFYKQNYDQVRSEIAKVDTEYTPVQVPRYVDALKQIQAKVHGIPGLEQMAAEVSNLLTKKEGIKLTDVQRVKELMDQHFNLYKMTGDVGEGVTKQGLANVRQDLRAFIEAEVKKSTGTDIKPLNNNVATAVGLDDFITTRSQRGLTRSNLRMGDLPIMAAAWGIAGPIGGVAALFLKKAYETPTVRLRIARYLDQISDAQRAKVQNQLRAGEVPPEMQQAAAGFWETIKRDGQRGFIKNPFENKIHAQDKATMEAFIDHARIGKKISENAFIEAEKLAEKFDISMDKGLARVANEFEKILNGTRSAPSTVLQPRDIHGKFDRL